MPKRSRVLVIGTTTDYIDWIRTARPDQALFVTSPDVRRQAREPQPSPLEEILCELTDGESVFHSLTAHLAIFNLHPAGVACFDCESLGLAAFIAERMGLVYPSTDAISNCRDKYLTRTLWHKNNIECPDYRLVRSTEDVLDFFSSIGKRCVLKPVSGSGSELIFNCDSEQSCETSFKVITEELRRREKNRLYNPPATGRPGSLPKNVWKEKNTAVISCWTAKGLS